MRPTKKSALWVEDRANQELANLAACVWESGRYDLTIAENASDALSTLETRRFDAIVVDVRLPPGHDHRWLELPPRPGMYAGGTQLGLVLLGCMLRPAEAAIKPCADLGWISPGRIAVLTIERSTEIQRELARLEIRTVREKKAFLPDHTLLDMIDALLGVTTGLRSSKII